MKITKVKATGLFVPISKPTTPISLPYAESLSGVVFGGYRSTLVQIETNEGIVGIGECMTRLSPKALVAIVEDLQPLLLGKNPLDTEPIWEMMYGVMMNRGHNRGFFIEAVSGIDVALWDIAGKARGEPIYQLLGGKHSDKLWAYASSLRFRGIEHTLETARLFLERGFNAMKLKIGKEIYNSNDVRMIEALRKEVGDHIVLMADANCGYANDVNRAAYVGKALEANGYLWFEEPISPDNIRGMKKLCKDLDIAVAGGETAFTRYDFRDLFSNEALDIIQPNACRTGGISEVKKIAAMSSAYHIPYAPHTGSCSAISITVALHLAAAIPNFLIYEFMQSDWVKEEPNPLRHHLLKEPVEKFKDGFMEAPDPRKPGLGIELDQEIVEKYRVS